MATHRQLWGLAEEAIDEYLDAVKQCLAHRKRDGGCLGYPATLLLFCIIDALSVYLTNEEVMIEGRRQKITPAHPFRVLNHQLLGFTLTHDQIRQLEVSCRNSLAHEALIRPGIVLVSERAKPVFTWSRRGVTVAVYEFYDRVSKAWVQFDRARIRSATGKRYGISSYAPPVNVQISTSLSSSVLSSSSLIVPSASGQV